MLPCGCSDEGVVDGAPRDAEAGELGPKGNRLVCTEERGRGEVVGEQAKSIGRRPTIRAGQPGQDRIRLEPRVA